MNKKSLFFENSQRKERVIAEIYDMRNVFKEIREFCAERDFHIYYTNYYIEESSVKDKTAWRFDFDVGSWSEFFYIYFDTFEQAESFRKCN